MGSFTGPVLERWGYLFESSGHECAIAGALTFGWEFCRDDLYPLAERWADYGTAVLGRCNCEAQAWVLMSRQVDILARLSEQYGDFVKKM